MLSVDRKFVFTLFWLSLGGWCVGQEEAQKNPPNVLWIVGENFDLDFGCYGAKQVQTPNVDQLASEGVRYTNVYSTSPVCAPSRSCFMVGMYATTTDMHHMRSHREDDYRLPDGVRPITHRLHDIGYTTGNITSIGDKTVGTGKLDLNFVNEGQLYSTDQWDHLVQNQPFFGQINLPEAEYDIYDRKSHEKPRVRWVGEQWHPPIATEENVTPPPYYPDHKIVRQEWARYLNSVSGADVRIGWIIDALKSAGVHDDTVIIFFGDNGRLEARGIHWCYDSGIHVPMVIRWGSHLKPLEHFTAGSVNDQVISLIDITATTLRIAGAEVPLSMQSRSFLGKDAGPVRQYAFSARDRIDETQIRQRSVRGKRYHYIRNFTQGTGFLSLNRYKEKCFLVKPLMRQMMADQKLSGPAADLMKPFPKEMLFDTQADPFEIKNLATSPDHAQTLVRMRTALTTWMIESRDRGDIAESPEVVEPFAGEMDQWFGTPDWAKSDESVK